MSGLEAAIPAAMGAIGSAGSAVGSGLSGLGSSAMGLGSSLMKPIMGLFGGGGPGDQITQGASLAGLGQGLQGALGPQSGVSIAPGAMQQMGQNVGMNPASIASAIPDMAGGVPQFSYDPSGTGITGAPAVSPALAGQMGLAQNAAQQQPPGNPAAAASSNVLQEIMRQRMQRRPHPSSPSVGMSPPAAQPVQLGNQPGQMPAAISPMERYAMLLRGMR